MSSGPPLKRLKTIDKFFDKYTYATAIQQVCSLTLIFYRATLCKRGLCFGPRVSLSVHPSRCHTGALCPNVWTYLHAVSATW